MSTRSNIAIKLKDKDINKVFMNYTNGHEYEFKPQKKYLQIYCHWDGYPEGVGENLRQNFSTYEEALNLILEGDCSTPGEPYTSRGEHYSDLMPREMDYPELEEEFLYIFEDDKWRCFNDENEEINLY